ncbi:MAG: hypothetical protein GYA80_07630, partial [Chloroflexi bacterium]|nr:hypothetical protein [Chloroflexota bacterium]
MTDSSLRPFFAPAGVMVVGASKDPTKLGYALARNLIRSGYAGAIHFINPRGGTLLGHPMYTRIADVPDPVELAIILVPPPFVPDTMREV